MYEAVKQNADKVPFVIPILVYNGEQSPYPGSTDLLASFDDQAEVKRYYQHSFILLDLTVMKDKQLLSNIWTACPTIILKYLRVANFLSILSKLLEPMQALHERGEDMIVEVVLKSVAWYTQIPDRSKLLDFAKEVTKETGAHMATAAQGWFDEGYDKGMGLGREEGITQGITKGVTQGRHEAFKEIIMKLSNAGMGVHAISKYLGMSTAEVQKVLAVSSSIAS